MKQSKQFHLNNEDIASWVKNLVIFLIPAFLVYSTQVIGVVQNGNSWSLTDFLPTQMTWGAIILYIANALTGLARKFLAGK